MSNSVARLRTARTYLTSVLLNLPILTNETSVASLLGLLDHLAENPDEYIEMINAKNQKNAERLVAYYDVLDVVLLCHAALAQDSPEFPTVYLNQILNIMFAYLTMDQRKEVEVYLAEKKYLPPLKLHLPNS